MGFNSTNYFKRLACALSGKSGIEHVYSFKRFPILITCTNESETSGDLFADMDWGCSDAGHLQLINLLDPSLIYSNYHTTGVVGKTWQIHHQKFFNFINTNNYKNVLEIGGASGKLAEHFLAHDKDFTWSIIEPSIKTSNTDTRIKFISSFFETHEFNGKFDTIVHSHCLEHVYDPIKFLNKINSLLDYGDCQYISIPNMRFGLENTAVNTLSFEHTFYIDDLVLEYILNKTGFKVVDKIVENHSIFVKAVKSKNIPDNHTDFSYVKELFNKYISNLNDDVLKINQNIKNNKIYLFGAHMFSLVLLNMGLLSNQVECILDNDAEKQNKRLYGTNFKVKSPNCLKEIKDPIVLIRAGVYTNEIKESILKINSTTVFV